jgi:hypothetical protein
MMVQPSLEIIAGSEIQAEVDTAAIGIDGRFRPIIIGDDDGVEIVITVDDARRLLTFLDEALKYLEFKSVFHHGRKQ